ncbi:hypothetical protein EJ08DRAFT_697253 [Tothia fuscella]|uniref:Uncharacterized protein n=1 Tax=Tothia fuscella TaxID=1048955 RepID=A0A9P4TZ40_9PEZI|nr:hypothetical protein EJ08DRAFT_697253 [Tothia fuscella]
MAIEYAGDESESININLMNTNKPSTAWISTLMKGEFGSPNLGVPYQAIQADAKAKPDMHSPWDFMEVRMDWTEQEVANAVTILFRHWPTGDRYTSQGPPANRTIAEVAWGRLFFNSSLWSIAQHRGYDARCWKIASCSINDWSLRGSSAYEAKALLSWKLVKPKPKKRIPAIVVSILSVAITIILIVNTFLYRKPWMKWTIRGTPVSTLGLRSLTKLSVNAELEPTPEPAPPGYHEFRNGFQDSRSIISPLSPTSGSIYTPTGQQSPSAATSFAGATMIGTSRMAEYESSDVILPVAMSPLHINIEDRRTSFRVPLCQEESESIVAKVPDKHLAYLSTHDFLRDELEPDGEGLASPTAITPSNCSLDNEKAAEKKNLFKAPKMTPVEVTDPKLVLASDVTPETQIEYLAGLVVLCSIIVSAVNFALTFSPALIEPFVASHYMSEVWVRKTISPFFISFIWVGPIITISARFLSTNYLRSGDLEEIARKAIGQTPRLIIPILIVTLLEYLLINSGVVTWLKYLPSLTWSEWPYTSTYVNFADWMTEMIELMYLLPNAAPSITFHYCTGVLWIVPVLLQFSWNILLGIVVVREI